MTLHTRWVASATMALNQFSFACSLADELLCPGCDWIHSSERRSVHADGHAHAMQDGIAGGAADVAGLIRASSAATAGTAASLKPDEAGLKLGALTGPEAAARLHALGVPSAMLSNGNGNGAVPPAAAGGTTMAGFHEQLLAAAAAQRPESQGVSVVR